MATVSERVQALTDRYFTGIKEDTAKNLGRTAGALAFCAVPYLAGIPFWEALGVAVWGFNGQIFFGLKSKTA